MIALQKASRDAQKKMQEREIEEEKKRQEEEFKNPKKPVLINFMSVH